MAMATQHERREIERAEPRGKTYLWALAIFLLCAVTLRQAPDGSFAFDDVAQVSKPSVHDLASTAFGPWWPGASQVRDWRPVTRLVILGEAWLAADKTGELERLRTHRGFTKLLFLASIVMLCFVARRWGWTDFQAATAALIAAYAPIRGEPLHQIVGQAETLAAIFMFCGLLHFRIGSRRDGANLRLIAAQSVFYALALGSKETALLYPLYLGLQELALEGSDLRRLPRRFWITQAALGVTLALYLLARNAVTGGLVRPAATPPAFENVFGTMNFFERVPGVLGGFGWAMTRFFVPVGLAPDYSAQSLPFERGWAWPMAWLGAGLALVAITGAMVSIRKRGRAWALIVGGLAAWALTSNFFFTIGVSLASRIWAFPALALALGVGWAAAGAIQNLYAKGRRRSAVYLGLALALWLMALAAVGLVRRFDWRSNLDLAARTVEIFPESWRGHHNLSRELYKLRRFEEGLEHARVAVRLQPQAALSWDQLGLNAMFTEGGAVEAEAAFMRALEINPSLELVQKHLRNLRKMTGAPG